MLQLFFRGSNEHIAHEQGVICTSTDDSDIDSIPFVPSGKAIDDIYSISGIQIINSTFSVDFPHLELRLLSAKKLGASQEARKRKHVLQCVFGIRAGKEGAGLG